MTASQAQQGTGCSEADVPLSGLPFDPDLSLKVGVRVQKSKSGRESECVHQAPGLDACRPGRA